MKVKVVKKFVCGVGVITVCSMLVGCHMSHEWQEATCTTPKTCSVGGETEGEALGHTWVEASCAEPKHCSTCGETEGEALTHSWTEATCKEPKHCSVCGETEGNALDHILTEANYQQPATCEVWGESVGEPLQSDFDKNGLSCNVQEDIAHDFILPCSVDSNYTTSGEITFSDYEVFSSDDTHESLDGYEWRTVTYTYVFDDENANLYGWKDLQVAITDYYNMQLLDDSFGDNNTFTVNFNGIDYTEAKFELEYLQNEWNDNGYIGKDQIFVRVPVGYDGIVYFVYDQSGDYANDIDKLRDSNTASFRLN